MILLSVLALKEPPPASQKSMGQKMLHNLYRSTRLRVPRQLAPPLVAMGEKPLCPTTHTNLL